MLDFSEEASEEDAKKDMAEDTDVKEGIVNVLNTEHQENPEKESSGRKENSEEKENSETENIQGLEENEDSADRQDVTAEAEILADPEDISFLTFIFIINVLMTLTQGVY